MKKQLLSFLAIVFCFQFATAQTASTVLEKGIPLKKGDCIFLNYDCDKNSLLYDAAKTDQDVKFKTLKDTLVYLFLVREDAINVYIRPLNPLNYNYGTVSEVIIDPINEAAADALALIIGELGSFMPKAIDTAGYTDVFENCKRFQALNATLSKIQEKLGNTRQDEIVRIFKDLKAISFTNEDLVRSSLASIKKDIQGIEDYFNNLNSLINKVNDLLKEDKLFTKDCFDNPILANYLYHVILKDFSLAYEEQSKRLANLLTAYKLVDDMYEEAKIGGKTEQLTWCIHIDELASYAGIISNFSITISEGGYELSEDNEIVKKESKELIKRSFSVRRFQRFVPEVSVGTAFTFFEYNTYGTTTDSTGQMRVAKPTKNMVRNLNISTMINFNYYCEESPIHPFWQIGFGINSEIPSILTGLGLRTNVIGSKRFTISGGLAMSWLKELQTLQFNDEISGTDDIDKDYTYSPTPKFSWYLGLQYNF